MTSRRLGATIGGLVAGAGGFLVLLLAGWLLYRRLWGDSTAALVVIAVLFGAAGLYSGWILGMLVFSALAGSGNDGEAAA